jgi:hypothetical protein
VPKDHEGDQHIERNKQIRGDQHIGELSTSGVKRISVR